MDDAQAREFIQNANLVSQHWIENERTSLYQHQANGEFLSIIVGVGDNPAIKPFWFGNYRYPDDFSFLDEFDGCWLECNGMSRLIHWKLAKENIPHRFMVGRIASPYGYDGIHFWIQLMDGRVVDYRLRMWLGDRPDVPKGVFAPEEHREIVQYWGEEQDEPVLPDAVAEVLRLDIGLP